jgi:hypothetical protein
MRMDSGGVLGRRKELAHKDWTLRGLSLAGIVGVLSLQHEAPSHENDPFHFSSPITSQIAVTPEHIGGCYQEYFLTLLGRGLLCTGLYRAPHCGLGNTDSFVFTNPAPHTILHEGDRAYVITHDKEALYTNDVPNIMEGLVQPDVERYAMPPNLLPDTHFKSTMKPAASLMHKIRKKAKILRTEVLEYTPSLESHVPGVKRPVMHPDLRNKQVLGVEEMMTTLEAVLTPVTEGFTSIIEEVLSNLQSMHVELREIQQTTATLRRMQEQQR